jgi:hypothetical protein
MLKMGSVDTLGEKARRVKASSRFEFLHTGVPRSIVTFMRLKEDDLLIDWDL